LYRRSFLSAAALPAVLAATGISGAKAQGTPFSQATVRDYARDLASRPFQAQDTALPGYISKLTYDQYRTLRFDKKQALWAGTDLPWQVEFSHRGFIYAGRVDINVVSDGRSVPVVYNSSMFGFDGIQRPTNEDLGFAGFRLHAPINKPDYFDEVTTFLGASYFRTVAKGLNYGLSARGLAIKTADPAGEEFPYFKTFWIERPAPGPYPGPVTVHALLDSPSVAAAFQFVITPGMDTAFETQATLFPRVDIDQVGIAPLTSMFLFDTNDRERIDDWRPAVHDSDGLLIATGHGEVLWRPLANPTRLQVSLFTDKSPKGFGLLQRKRSFAEYQDLESRYENRPSAWVEPVGDWGEGAVTLVEIPTNKEVNDNIVAFWRPKQKLQAKIPYTFAYKLHWTALPTQTPAHVADTMIGGNDKGVRYVVLDFAGLPATPALRADVTSNKGELRNVVSQPNEVAGGWRVSFELRAGSETAVELHARLLDGDKPVSETWLYRWTSA